MTDIRQQAIDAIRVLSMDAVQQANSGHPGTPMALAPVGYALFHKHLRHNPSDPLWLDRDRFVLSVGPASMLIYSVLHLSGYNLSEEDIRNFRQWGSPTAGHPEYGHAPGIETTTGPLGQGVANSVGMALAECWLAKRYNRPGHDIVDHFTYALCSDGDMMEGISHEAAAIAGHQKLGKLIWIFDDNQITIDGGIDLSSSTNQEKRFEAYGWHIAHVSNGNDLDEIDRAIIEAKRESERPSLIVLKTTIGYGSPGKAGTSAAHGAPLGQDEITRTKKNLKYPSLEPFHVEDSVYKHWAACVVKGQQLQEDWQERFSLYQEETPDLAAEFLQVMSEELPEGWDEQIPDLTAAENEDATRGWSGKILQGVASRVPNLIGGSADLAGSNKTTIGHSDNFLPSSPGGRNIHYGIREHGMASIMNGMALHGGVRPFGGTFLIFSDYMRPAIRLAALMGQPVIYVFSHDSIGLGEDGPTHQPIEQLAALRAIPNLCDLRPGDAAETEVAWRVALERTEGPSFLALTRQKVVVLDRNGAFAKAEGLRRGGYVLAEAASGAPQVILIASGSELGITLKAQKQLEAEGTSTRVVSLPSWYLFSKQEKAYRDSVLPPEISNKISIEAASTFGWTHWVGTSGHSLGVNHFGASAPSDILFEKFGLTVEEIVKTVRNKPTL